MEDQTTTDEGYVPEYDLSEVQEAAVEPTTVEETPQFVTKQDFNEAIQNLAETLKGAIPQPKVETQNTEDVYAALAEKFYDNPAQAFAEVAKIAAKQAKEETINQLSGPLGDIYRDFNTRSVTGGATGLEAEYLQNLASKNLINAETMQNPELRDVVTRAAKQYAQEKQGVRPPSAEGAVGGNGRFMSGEERANKEAFERAFPGLDYNKTLKEFK